MTDQNILLHFAAPKVSRELMYFQALRAQYFQYYNYFQYFQVARAQSFQY